MFERSFWGREGLVILRELPSARSALSVSEEVLFRVRSAQDDSIAEEIV